MSSPNHLKMRTQLAPDLVTARLFIDRHYHHIVPHWRRQCFQGDCQPDRPGRSLSRNLYGPCYQHYFVSAVQNDICFATLKSIAASFDEITMIAGPVAQAGCSNPPRPADLTPTTFRTDARIYPRDVTSSNTWLHEEHYDCHTLAEEIDRGCTKVLAEPGYRTCRQRGTERHCQYLGPYSRNLLLKKPHEMTRKAPNTRQGYFVRIHLDSG